MALSEDELVQKFADHEPMLRAFVQSHLPQRIRPLIDSEDIIQETYSDAWRHIGDFRGGSLAAWLKTIARRNIVDRVRSLATRRRGGGVNKLRLGEGSASSGITVASPQETPSKDAVNAENKAFLEQCLGSLSPECQLVIRRCYFEQRTVVEIAQELQITKRAAQMRIHRAIVKLRFRLLPQVSDFPI